MSPTIILISGANRGLGKGLLERYLVQPNHIVIAANRDPSHSTSKALSELPVGSNSRLIVVKVDASSSSDPFVAVKELVSQGVAHLDIVIANAGIAAVFPRVSDLKVPDLQAHINSNVFGVVWLFQATLQLLSKAENPKWVTMGSNPPPIPNAAYGASKAAAHWLTKRINAEEEKLTAFVIMPGWVQTEGGNESARFFGLEKAPLGIKESCDGMGGLIANSGKESHGGRFWHYDGEELAL